MANNHKLTRDEQETVIRSSAADSEWDICTADPRIIRYLKRQGYQPIPDRQFSDYLSCRVPFGKVRIRTCKVKASSRKSESVLRAKARFDSQGQKEPASKIAASVVVAV